MTLVLFNTLTRTKEEFEPRTRNFVRLYTCGLTVYDYMHIGHARTYLFWDVFRRFLYFLGYQMVSVINYTDIEDRIITRANEREISIRELADEFIEAFDDDCDALGIMPYTVHCRATDYVPEMIAMVSALIEKGNAYEIDGDVYFDVHSFPRYGKLSGHNLDDLEAGARVEVDERKKNPADFALWKSAKPDEPSWESPWGPGRPGWHIECSVMSSHFLGEWLDIHGGAVDNMFPHHENEIAQSEAYLGLDGSKERWCNFFMHPEHLLVEDTKMSKSLGNFITVRQLLEANDPQAVRLYFLGNHYRTQMNFTDSGLEGAKSALARIANFVQVGRERFAALLESGAEGDGRLIELAAKLESDFVRAMEDDVNCPEALAAVFEFIKSVNLIGWDAVESPLEAMFALSVLDQMLGIFGLAIPDSGGGGEAAELADGLMELIISIRKRARDKRDFEAADAVRDGLVKLGIALEDTSGGTRWKLDGN